MTSSLCLLSAISIPFSLMYRVIVIIFTLLSAQDTVNTHHFHKPAAAAVSVARIRRPAIHPSLEVVPPSSSTRYVCHTLQRCAINDIASPRLRCFKGGSADQSHFSHASPSTLDQASPPHVGEECVHPFLFCAISYLQVHCAECDRAMTMITFVTVPVRGRRSRRWQQQPS